MAEDFGAAISTYHAAAWQVLNDPAAWAQEAQRAGAAPLPWPPPMPATQAGRLFRLLVMADVDVVLCLLHINGDPLSPGLVPGADDPKMQTVLRVARRSMLAGEAAVVAAFGGARITGKRDYLNATREQWAEVALALARRDGLTRDEAFALLDIPRRQGFRAIKRRRTRRK
jgi:hypothetical protein